MTFLPGTAGRRRVYLMRHGHVDYLTGHGHVSQVVLTGRGKGEARAAGAALTHVSFDRAICSGLPRTRLTAEAVLGEQTHTAPELEVNEALVEILPPEDDGSGSRNGRLGVPREKISSVLAFAFERADKPGAAISEGGETFADAQARAVGAIERLLRQSGWHTALIVAHEGINRLILSWAATGGLSAAGAFEQDTGCVNILDFDLVPDDTGDALHLERRILKAVNLTPYNWLKHGMNLTSLEAIFRREDERPDAPPEEA